MLIFFSNGNDGQIAMYLKLVESLGKFVSAEFKLVFASDKLSENNIFELESIGVEFFPLSLEYVDLFNQKMISNTHPFGKIAKPFVIKSYLEEATINSDDVFVFLDPDILCQGSIDPLLHLMPDNGVIFAHQSDKADSNRSIVTRFAKSGKKLEDYAEQREINTGFFLGKVSNVKKLVGLWSEFMINSENVSFKDHDSKYSSILNAWHDQDYFRLFVRKENLNLELKFIDETYVAHLCDTLSSKMSANGNQVQNHETGTYPILVHFAGGSHKEFYSISKLYGRKSDFFKNLIIDKPKSILLRIMTLFNINYENK